MNFQARGCHAIVYTVDLPSWLLRDVFMEIVTQFRQVLHHEPVTMMEEMSGPPVQRRGHKCLMESNSGSSTATYCTPK
jgi:hypothetical protein